MVSGVLDAAGIPLGEEEVAVLIGEPEPIQRPRALPISSARFAHVPLEPLLAQSLGIEFSQRKYSERLRKFPFLTVPHSFIHASVSRRRRFGLHPKL
jgi:hypothetical protein